MPVFYTPCKREIKSISKFRFRAFLVMSPSERCETRNTGWVISEKQCPANIYEGRGGLKSVSVAQICAVCHGLQRGGGGRDMIQLLLIKGAGISGTSITLYYS